jgi:hypothetical protein
MTAQRVYLAVIAALLVVIAAIVYKFRRRRFHACG